MDFADWAGVAGFFVALAVAGVQIWLIFFVRSELIADIRVEFAADKPAGLNVAIINVGRKKDVA